MWHAELPGGLHQGRTQACADLELLRLKIVRALLNRMQACLSPLSIDPSFCQLISMHHTCLLPRFF